MRPKKPNITFKVLSSYFVLAVLVVIAAWFIYHEVLMVNNKDSSASQSKKLLEISSLLAQIYENENLAKSALLSPKTKKFKSYSNGVAAIQKKIDSLQSSERYFKGNSQLDSISILLTKKYKNISQLRQIKISNETDISFKVGIEELSKMQSSLGKITIDHLIAAPDKLEPHQRKAIDKLIVILNDNLRNDVKNTANQKTLDSVITQSKSLLNDLRNEAKNERLALYEKERELLANDLIISEQLRKLVSQIEYDVYLNSVQTASIQKASEEKAILIIKLAGGIGFLLTIIFSFFILNDFWKSQSYRRQLEVAKRYTESLLSSREQLIKMVSHDLKTPLSTIKGYSELLGNNTYSDKEKNIFITRVKNAVAFITTLADDLMDYLKLDTGKISILKKPFALIKLVEETTWSIHEVYKHKPISFSMVVPESYRTAYFMGDAIRIQQIISNLLSNAFKFTDSGKISVILKIDDKTDNRCLISVTVSDTGIGIPKDQQHLLFQEFSRIAVSRKGNGLGLTISKKLANAMNGEINFTSTEGVGSTFSFNLPLNKIAVEAATDFSTKKLNGIKHNPVAIIVDDHHEIRDIFKALLKPWNIKTVDFSSPKDALKLLHTMDYDIVFTDLQIPGMNGYEFARILRKTDQLTPIIAMSGAINNNFSEHIPSPFSGALKKPFQLDKITACLDTHLKLKPSHKKITAKKYNLSELNLFLQNDKQLIQEVLETFFMNTSKNLVLLKKAAAKNDIKTIKDLAHKMQSMFSQIEVNEAIVYLDKLQNNRSTQEETKIAIDGLYRLTGELKKEILAEVYAK